MLNHHDCLGFCALTEDEIDAIVEHEHIPLLAAAIMGNYLLERGGDGVLRLKQFILDDIAAAELNGRHRHANELRLVLAHFCKAHPDRRPPFTH